MVGARTRIQSHSFICELVTIGDGLLHRPRRHVHQRHVRDAAARRAATAASGGSTTVGNNVSIGSNATILPVSIADGVVIGAGAVVTRDLWRTRHLRRQPGALLRTL